jgi:hypothetical protein
VIVFIFIVILLRADNTALFPFYTNTKDKNVTVWVVAKSSKGEKTYIKVTMPSNELVKKYVWIGFYKNRDIYIRKGGL